MTKLTPEENACNVQTFEHIIMVQKYMHLLIVDLLNRSRVHDQSKLKTPEVEAFASVMENLGPSTFNSPEYNAAKALIAPALAHHYANNSHHPEHHAEGVNDMTLLDLLEMFCDWKASSLRHNNGNLLLSIDINAERFGMSTQLARIFRNTAKLIDHH